MFRILTYFLLTLFLISVVRSIVRVVLNAFAQMMREQPVAQGAGARVRPQPRPSVPLTGELKKDPVCGTYTSAATALQKTVRGETFYFCSPQCRDRFV
jgi:YHS domain-containing protein